MKFKILALAALMGLGSVSVQAGELPNGPHVVTSGTASVDAVPDIATLAIEVNVSAKDAASAKKQADDRVAQYLTFLQKNGVEKKDINAANLRTQPEYDYLKDGKTQLKGYRAVRQVEVTLRQLDKMNELLDGALKSGLNEIRSVSLGVAHPEEYKDKARK
ncbi:oxidative stress defense protein, partial [Cedecea sp. VD20]